jgi:DNA-binding NtrC family response regulator
LRERSEDVPQIFEHYLQRFTGRNSAKGMLTRAARELLSAYAWPGNIRQLRNIAEVVAYAASEVVDARDISSVLGEQQRSMGSSNFISIPESNSLKQMESEIIRSLLAKYPAEDVCQRLGISRVTLWRKMKKMPINADSL